MALLFQEPAPWPSPPINRANRTQKHLRPQLDPFCGSSHVPAASSLSGTIPSRRFPRPLAPSHAIRTRTNSQVGPKQRPSFPPLQHSIVSGGPSNQPNNKSRLHLSSRSHTSRRRLAARSVGWFKPCLLLLLLLAAAMYRSGLGCVAPSLARTHWTDMSSCERRRSPLVAGASSAAPVKPTVPEPRRALPLAGSAERRWLCRVL
jgi:hypothetical protein